MIIVFGSLNVDIIMPVGHFPAPGETVLCATDYLSRSGGKGSNQAVAAAKVGTKVAMVGKVGDDGFGRRSVNNLKGHGIWTAGIGMSERPTGHATIAVDARGENMVMVAPGANLDATSDQVPDEILTNKNYLLTQLECSPKETLALLQRAKARGTVTILNPSPAELLTSDFLSHVDYLIVNEVEARQIAMILGVEAFDNDAALARNLAAIRKNSVIITMGEKGSVAARGPDVWMISSLPVETVDTTGAGDAFCGIFAACLQEGLEWLTALHHAGVGASLSCLGLGAQAGMPFMDDIRASIHKAPAPRKV